MSESNNHLQGKVVVVTGAGSGFGRLVSQRVAELGGVPVCGDINAAAVEETAGAVRDQGGRVLAQRVDVTDVNEMRGLIGAAVESFGSVDVLVNNAGIMPLAFYADHEKAMDAWYRCIDVNFKGVLNGIVAAYDQMIAQGRGHVVNLSSIYSNFPVVGAGVYGATKAAVNFLSESLRAEAQGRIKVTNVRPTGVPGTALASGIVNDQAIVGILGQNAPAYTQMMQAHMAGELPDAHLSADSIEYYALEPEHLAEQIVYAINQPWGVSISDLTVRASGDRYVL